VSMPISSSFKLAKLIGAGDTGSNVPMGEFGAETGWDSHDSRSLLSPLLYVEKFRRRCSI
jgi:hypothetical protein